MLSPPSATYSTLRGGLPSVLIPHLEPPNGESLSLFNTDFHIFFPFPHSKNSFMPYCSRAFLVLNLLPGLTTAQYSRLRIYLSVSCPCVPGTPFFKTPCHSSLPFLSVGCRVLFGKVAPPSSIGSYQSSGLCPIAKATANFSLCR